MTVSLCLLLEAPTAIRALDDGNITGGVEEAISVVETVPLEEGHVRPLVLLKCSCANNKIGNGRVRKARRADLFVLADEIGQRSRLAAGFEEGGACDAPEVDVGGSEGIQWVCPRWHAAGVIHDVPNK